MNNSMTIAQFATSTDPIAQLLNRVQWNNVTLADVRAAVLDWQPSSSTWGGWKQ